MPRYKYDSPYNGSGALTREQFLFSETRIVARLICDDGLGDKDAIEEVVRDNLFQFPTEREIKRVASACVRRLRIIDDERLIDMNVFFMQLQEQDDAVASWTDATIKKIKQVLNKILAENEYIDGPRADHINPVWLTRN